MPLPAPPAAAAVLTVSLGAVVANWRALGSRLDRAECAAVVKADAYGLGAARVAPALAAAGCSTFFVALLDEGAALRPLLPGATIIALSGLLPGAEADHAGLAIVPVLNSLGDIARWQDYARQTGEAQPAWIHLDTGMNRLGLCAGEAVTLAAEPERLDGIRVLGWMSHLACADQRFHPASSAQLGRFHQHLARLPKARRSLANSSGLCRGRAFHLDLVRPGAALYGINPTPETDNPQQPVIQFAARVLQVRPVDTGMTVGYGAGHDVVRRGRVATIAAGYADGWLRSLGNRGRVYFGGRPAPVVGRISMDLITVDVTDLPEALVRPGDWAELIGPHHTVDQVAAEAGTIGYDVLTGLSRRCHRVWLSSAKGDQWNS
ncbi:MAG: alanine racemase [Rhodospirillaceae bacterium]